ncbi:MAG: hypothetical protein H0X30_07140 [Anaerolineae bacterium]|nr:hypothetical protein [Anaerolineae bacterium]
MSLKMRLCLFQGVTHEDVFAAYEQFYRELDKTLVTSEFEIGNDHQIDIYQQAHDWVVVGLDGGWERGIRQAAYLSVSRSLDCAGFFIYVYVGWGYELFSDGVVRDQFISMGDPDGPAYCDDTANGCNGDLDKIIQLFPFLNVKDITPYLVRLMYPNMNPSLSVAERAKFDLDYKKIVDVPPRSGDEFMRFDQCGVLNFLRVLGVEVEMRAYQDKNGYTENYVTFLAPVYKSFSVSD